MNYLQKNIVEEICDKQCRLFFSQKEYDELAGLVKELEEKIDEEEIEVDSADFCNLDIHFPIIDAKGLLDYCSDLAKVGDYKPLKNKVIELQAKVNNI